MKGPLAALIIRFFAALPMPIAQALGWLLGRLLYWLPNNSKRQTQLNIQRCLPQLSAAEQKHLLQQSLAHTAMAMMEMGHNWCGSPDQQRRRIKAVTGVELLASEAPAGRIVLTPHFGNWELFASWLAQQTPLTALYKPAKLTQLDNLIAAGRQAAGMALAPASAKGVMSLKRALKKQQSILILPDQEPPKQSAVKVNFFAQPAYTMTLASQLAQAGKDGRAPQVLLGWAKRLGIGKGFAIELLDVTDALGQEDLQASVQAMNDAVASLVAQEPAQYQWEYRRFKQTLESS